MDDNSTEEATNIDEKVKAIELLLNSAEIEQFQNVSEHLKQQLVDEAQQVLKAFEEKYEFLEEKINHYSGRLRKLQKALINEIKSDIDYFKKNQSTLRGKLIIMNAEKLKSNVSTLSQVKFFEIVDNESTSLVISSNAKVEGLLDKFVDHEPLQEETSSDINDENMEDWPEGLNFDCPIENKSSTSTNYRPSNAHYYKIKKHSVFKGFIMEVKILNIISMNEFYVQNSFPEHMNKDAAFLKSFQEFYSREGFKCLVLEKPRRNFIAAYNNGTWNRVRIVEISPVSETCKLFLIDAGRYEIAKLSEIVKLSKKFFDRRQISIRCAIADVAPLEKNGLRFPSQAVDEFKMFAKDPNYKVKLVFRNDTKDDDQNEIASCVVFICGLDDGKEINFNSVMVNKKYAASTGESSEGLMVLVNPDIDKKVERVGRNQKEDEILEQIEPTIRVPVKIIKVVSPQEFYVAIECREEAIEKIEQKINNTDQLNDNLMNGWEENDLCLAFISSEETIGKWYRGVIQQTFADACKVFLVDYAVYHTVSFENLSEIPKKFSSILPRAIKVHLANTFPPCNSATWPLKSCEFLSELLCAYKSHSISIIDEADENGSFPVLLFGVVKTGIREQYHNILMYMYQEGYCYTKFRIEDEKFICNERLINPYDLKFVDEVTTASELCDQILNIKQEKPNIEAIEEERITVLWNGEHMNYSPKKINSWLPSKPLTIGQSFYGTPTHVDLDGVIYFQTREQTAMANVLCWKITALYGTHTINNARQDNRILKPGDCVIAPYQDEKFYRAIVIRQITEQENTYRIQFVDYGTLLSVNVENIYPLVIGENIPIQVSRLILIDIMPSLGFEWSEDELDFLQSRICDNLCNVSVVCDCPDPEIKGVVICVEANSVWIADVAKQAILEGKGRNLRADDTWPIALKKVDAPENNTTQPKEEMTLQSNLIKPTIQAIDVNMEVMKEFLTKNVESSSPEKPRYKRLVHRRPPTLTVPYKQNRNDIVKRNLLKRTKTFDMRQIDSKEFECKLISVHDPMSFTFNVEPLIPEIQDAFNALLVHYENTPNAFFEPFKSITRAVKKSCLVETEDDLWMRGEIIEVDDDSIATVYLIDIGKIDAFHIKLLRKMDMKSLKCPSKIIKVKLDVKSMPAESEVSSIAEYLIEHFMDKKLKAVIKNYDNGIPVVGISIAHE